MQSPWADTKFTYRAAHFILIELALAEVVFEIHTRVAPLPGPAVSIVVTDALLLRVAYARFAL